MAVLGDVVTAAGRRWGDAVAYVAPSGWRLSYAALDRLSDEVAGGLAARGVGIGSVVALVLPPWPEFVVLYAAAAKLGALTAGVNDRLTAAERWACLDAVGPAVVFDASNVTAATSDETCLADVRVPGYEPRPVDPNLPLAIVFTSGTTGAPKGAVYGGRQLDAITRVDTGWQWGGGSAGMAGTTFAHLGPMTKLPGTLVRGGTTHVLERWRAADALALIEREQMVGIGGIPTQIALMLAEPSFSSLNLNSVRAIIMGGGPATPALVRAARAGFGAAVATRYSCTEAGIGTGTAFDAPPEDAELTVGRAQPGVELLVVDDGGAPVPPGEIGEVCFRSDAVMSGYWGEPPLPPGAAVHTGDLGRVDQLGRLHLAGRARERYVRGGENVHPQEVEAVLADAPGVVEVVIVARPDDTWGEVGVAVVVASAGAQPPSLESLRRHGSGRLAPFKLPDELRVVDELPLTPMEKVDRRALARLVAPGDG